MINLELPKKIEDTRALLRQFSEGGLRPLSRKYDLLEQKEMPQELYDLAKLLGGGRKRGDAGSGAEAEGGNRNANNMSMVVSSAEICWGDVGLFLALPNIGLGNAAVSAVATEEQKAEWGELFAAMAITEPGAGSDSAGIKTTQYWMAMNGCSTVKKSLSLTAIAASRWWFGLHWISSLARRLSNHSWCQRVRPV